MQLIRPSLEDLFFEAVTDPTTGLRPARRDPATASRQDHMSQTLALLLDAYRDLNSRRMFWIVLILSGLVAASFAAIGLTPTGFEIFTWKFTSYFFNSKVVSPGDFYKSIFLNWGVDLWLSTIAAALALISTASLFPDFIAAGAIDLYLSKPISRLRLFLTKYLCGLLFVALQIACFCAASFPGHRHPRRRLGAGDFSCRSHRRAVFQLSFLFLRSDRSLDAVHGRRGASDVFILGRRRLPPHHGNHAADLQAHRS